MSCISTNLGKTWENQENLEQTKRETETFYPPFCFLIKIAIVIMLELTCALGPAKQKSENLSFPKTRDSMLR